MNTLFSLATIALIVVGSVYALYILYFLRGLSRLRGGRNDRKFSVAVIVAARNEERYIEQCVRSLLNQDYPRDKFSIVVVDDESTDNTAKIVEQLSNEYPNLRLLHAEGNRPAVSPKINALEKGIRNTSSELIFTTDADCFVGPQWISSLVKCFDDIVGVVSGVTIFKKTENISPLLFGFQYLDFFSQTACGAGAIGMNAVNNCNGSNMAFRRSAFEAVGGYAEISHVNSGSDSLLAQRILAATPWRMNFVYTPESHVTTLPLASWMEVLHQRMRWAGSTPNYRWTALIFLVASFFFYLLLFLFLPASLMYPSTMFAVLIIFFIKILLDDLIITKFTKMTDIKGLKKYFLISELIHVPFILLAAIGSLTRKFEWKQRHMKRTIEQTV
ncbi:MAG: glycosyltransferase [Bacteroidota bacterium]|nr:glycosyltransferase [Bacteroidota bacterium]